MIGSGGLPTRPTKNVCGPAAEPGEECDCGVRKVGHVWRPGRLRDRVRYHLCKPR